jgi:hypothetical protein
MLIGLALLAAFGSSIVADEQKDWVPTTGTVTRVGGRAPSGGRYGWTSNNWEHVEYRVGLKTYTFRDSTTFPSTVGSSVFFEYNRADPTDVRKADGSVLWLLRIVILLVMGAVAVSGAVKAGRVIAERWQAHRLLASGHRLMTKISYAQETSTDRGAWREALVRLGRLHYWNIRCRVEVTGGGWSVLASSPDWSFDPTPLIAVQNCDQLPVYFDDSGRKIKVFVDDRALRQAARRSETATG